MLFARMFIVSIVLLSRYVYQAGFQSPASDRLRKYSGEIRTPHIKFIESLRFVRDGLHDVGENRIDIDMTARRTFDHANDVNYVCDDELRTACFGQNEQNIPEQDRK
eukprot:3808557-Heterocapsa_arctica.AAC.1